MMKKCNKCHVSLNTNLDKCPLCHGIISDTETYEHTFPIVPNLYKKHNLLYKILTFISLVSSSSCIILNLLISNRISWSYFVIIGIISFWLTLLATIKKSNHFIKMLFTEFNLVIIISIVWDYITGWHQWSLNYVLPLMCIAYIIIIFIMRIFFKYYIRDNIIYITINSFLGLLPFFLLLFNVVTVSWPSYTSIIISLVVLFLLGVFNRRSLNEELERRFHI